MAEVSARDGSGPKMKDPLLQIEPALAPYGFRRVRDGDRGCLCNAILKRQTFNTNRAVAFVWVDTFPDDLVPVLKRVKKEVAFRCGFFPFLYGIGTQLILVVASSVPEKVELDRYVDKFDNQWSIIQGLYLLQADSGLVASARTWGQLVTGKYEDVILAALGQTGDKPAPPIAGANPG
ncbi:MAG TPA: hypothetical protein VL171_01595 [Verrucomicrobiae bacterium]|nr:hypothetical protein [Verrucomicrobiae bacterium]